MKYQNFMVCLCIAYICPHNDLNLSQLVGLTWIIIDIFHFLLLFSPILIKFLYICISLRSFNWSYKKMEYEICFTRMHECIPTPPIVTFLHNKILKYNSIILSHFPHPSAPAMHGRAYHYGSNLSSSYKYISYI